MKIRNMKQVKQVTAHMKDVKMKRLFRRNQIIITTLAVMIAAAGYLIMQENAILPQQAISMKPG